jgi:hypothetical protein
VLDTVLWEDTCTGQSDRLKPAYKAILTEFSQQFGAGTDYGGGRRPLPDYLSERVANLRRILSQLPDGGAAQHRLSQCLGAVDRAGVGGRQGGLIGRQDVYTGKCPATTCLATRIIIFIDRHTSAV